MSVHELRSARARGEIYEVQPGVSAASWTPRTTELERFAAVLAAGEDAALASLSALAVYGARAEPERVHICVAHGRKPRLFDVVVHRSRVWSPGDIRTIGGLDVTDPVRTAFDAAEILRPRSLRGAVEKMVIDGHVTGADIAGELRRMHGRHGLKRIRPILEFMPPELAAFDSKLEADFLHLVEDAFLPRPEHHVQILTASREYEVDFLWRSPALVVEVDGPHHFVPEQRRFDSRRDAALAAAGWPVHRFLDTEIRRDPEYVKSTLRRLLRTPDVGTRSGSTTPLTSPRP
ncbi:MAG: DUF559 domain-containing protein [Acidimicrobiia bacterium]